MKEEALELAKDYENGKAVSVQVVAMIRRLVEELDKQGEPVAWMAEHFDGRKRVEIAGNVYDQDVGWGHKRIPLYITPQTKPLSDEEIENLLRQSIWALGLNTDWTEDENWADAITVFRAIIERHEGKENE